MKYCSGCGEASDTCRCAYAKESYAADQRRSTWSIASLNPHYLIFSFVMIVMTLCVLCILRGLPTSDTKTPALDRYLSVHVSVEKEVNADYVIWRIGFQSTGNDIKALQQKFQTDRTRILNFLKQHGFSDSEISIGAPRIEDQFARDWGQADVQKLPEDARYILNSRVKVLTSNVRAVEMASNAQDTLIQDGIILTKDKWAANPRYLLHNRTEIERELYAQAIQKSHAIAMQLAQGMNARIINVRHTTQQDPVIITAQGSRDRYSEDAHRGPIKNALLDMTVTYNIE